MCRVPPLLGLKAGEIYVELFSRPESRDPPESPPERVDLRRSVRHAKLDTRNAEVGGDLAVQSVAYACEVYSVQGLGAMRHSRHQ